MRSPLCRATSREPISIPSHFSRMRKGKTILLVTHHIHEIPPEIRRVVLLKKGRILEDGEKKAVLSERTLSHLFDCPVTLISANGWYQALPGG